ncbi:MAG: methionyl-tRNA formyltransferase [Betaproteobacteria bacterium]|nr:methionyl-tRNA formyltransferase [Betaproteobacteria bacterium]
MRIVFAGTPEFARTALLALYQAGHEIIAVLTQPDRPSGRGMKLVPSAVKQAALALNLPVWQPTTLRDAMLQSELQALSPDVMVVAAYGQILPLAVLEIPRLGCLNIHASLLPRWRGAAPIHRAIAAGDTQTGIAIMQMDAGLDTGAICLQQAMDISPSDTLGSLHDKLAVLGGELIVEALQRAASGTLTAHMQPLEGVTYASKISRSEAQIDFRETAEQIERKVRAFNPAPGAWLLWQDKPVKVWQAKTLADSGAPGKVLRADEQGIVIACGQGALCITELQMPGGKKQTVAQWLAGHTVPDGLTV